MHRTTATFAALCLATGPALAAGTVVLRMIPRAESIPSGGTMVLDLFLDFSSVTSGIEIAVWKFDILGHTNGTLIGDINDAIYDRGVNNGVSSGADLLDYAAGKLPPSLGHPIPNFLGTVSFTDSRTASNDYLVSLAIVDYAPPDGALHVYISGAGSMSRSSYTSSTGVNHLVEFDITPFQVIVPAPGSLAALGLASVFAGRRRRADS
jgi:hypothetical protein